jgi:hypothetical protein
MGAREERAGETPEGKEGYPLSDIGLVMEAVVAVSP